MITIDALGERGLPTSARCEDEVSMAGSAPPRKRPRRVWKKLQARGFAAHFGGAPVPRLQTRTEVVYYDHRDELIAQRDAGLVELKIPDVIFAPSVPEMSTLRYASKDERLQAVGEEFRALESTLCCSRAKLLARAQECREAELLSKGLKEQMALMQDCIDGLSAEQDRLKRAIATLSQASIELAIDGRRPSDLKLSFDPKGGE